MTALYFISIPLFLLFSAFFSASEIAFASLNKYHLTQEKGAKKSLTSFLALKIYDDYDKVLGTILVGNTLVNIFASSVATVLVIKYLGDDMAFVATIVMTLLVLVFGEVSPKVMAKRIPDKFAKTVSVPLYVISLILRPVTFVFVVFVKLISKLWENKKTAKDSVTEDDLENIIDIVEDEGVLDEEECDLIQNALDFADVCAYEIITPRVDIVGLDIRDPYEINIKKIFDSSYSRLPIYEETTDNIIGVLHLNHVFKELITKEKINIRELMMPVTFVHKTMPLNDVLEKMKTTKSQMVVVLDEYGGTMGIITMEDVLEQLVGEIFDETDDLEKEFVCIDDTHFLVDGDMRINDFFDEFDIDFDEEEYDDITVGGFVTTMLEGNTEIGKEFCFEGIKITVKEADEKRIEKILAEIV